MGKESNLHAALILLPSLVNADGSAAAIMNYYQALVDDGWKVDFLLVQKTENDRTKAISQQGGRIFTLPQCNKYFPQVAKQIAGVVQNGKYDVVHVNIPGHVAYRTLLQAEKAHVPVRIFHCHNPRNCLNWKTRISTRIYDTLCLRHANRRAACSKSAGFSRFGHRSFWVVKNLIEPSGFFFDPAARDKIRKRLGVEDGVIVGVVGRITPQKNPLFLVDCFAAFQKVEPRAFLLWIGEGELKQKVKQRLEEKGLEKVSCFPGTIREVGKWYSAMDLFLLPSKFEGLGIAFLEAQCSGLPCFGSDGVPAEAAVTELMHRISLQKRPEEWAVEIQRTMEQKEERRSRGETFQQAGYTLKSGSHELFQLYDLWIHDRTDHE